MIAFLKGTVENLTESSVILNVNDVGYQILISSRDAANIPGRGETVKIFTWMSVSQDAIRLYGFISEEDLEAFKLLLNVSGIGPKAAQGVLSALTAEELRFAVLAGDAKTIAKAPGIGAKGAQKIILELKDKFSVEDIFENESGGTENPAAGGLGNTPASDEALQALIALGFSGSESIRAIRSAAVTEDMDAEQILKQALRQL